MSKNIGLLLGSFDPPHIGHVWAANYALNNGMDEVWVVPAWENPCKQNQTPYTYRLEMCRNTFTIDGYESEDGRIRVTDLDSNFKSHYTYEGLEKLLHNINRSHEQSVNLGHPECFDYKFYIIGGTDIAQQIPKWKNGDWIQKNFGVVEVPRVGVTNDKTEIGIECSSTAIREMIKNIKSPIPFISNTLLDYIYKNKLYV